MARMRTIKPEFWTDRKIVGLSPFARLLYIGSWNFACDAGHLTDDADELHMKVLPRDDVDAGELLKEIVAARRIEVRVTPSGREYLFIPKLVEHQKIDTRWVPRCPICTELRGSTPVEASPKLPETPVSLGVLTETPRNSSGTGTGTGTGKGREGAKRATSLPDDFSISEAMRTWAEERHLGRRQTLAETERFKDWCRANGRTYKDWPAGWRTWMSRVVPDASNEPSHIPEWAR